MSLLNLCRVATLEDEVKAINQDKPHQVQGSRFKVPLRHPELDSSLIYFYFIGVQASKLGTGSPDGI